MYLFRNTSRKAPVGERPEEPKLVYPKLFPNAVLSLSKIDGKYLSRVRLRSFSTRELDFVRLTGMLSMPPVDAGEKLVVQGAGDNNAPFSLSGTVTEANRLNIKLGSLALMTGTNLRESPRYPVNRKAIILRPELMNSEKYPEPCDLVDISMTGARIRSDKVYAQDQMLKLRVELYERAGRISFLCQVVRAAYSETGFNEYGLLFEELPTAKKIYLREDLDWLATH
jgi:hypothetical protein